MGTMIHKGYFENLIWLLKFDALSAPMVLALYLPYNILWLHYSLEQLERWVFTSMIMFALANVVLTPYYAFIYRKIGLKPKEQEKNA